MVHATRALCLATALLTLAAPHADAWPRHHRGARHPAAAHRPWRHHARPAAPRPPAHAWWGKHTVTASTIRVHDGDTFYVGPETIRLRSIDTPELGAPRAAAATHRLTALLHAGPVTIVPRAEDVYGRTVADVYVDGRNVADVLRREGFQKPR